MRFAALMFCLFACAEAAAREVLPPDVRELGERVDEAARALRGVRAEMATAQRTFAVMDTRLRRATSMLVRSQAFPPEVWLARAVLAGEPAASGVAAMAVRQGVREVGHVDGRVKDLRRIYGEAGARVAALREAQAGYAAARGKLSAQERSALQAARVEVESLVAGLTALRSAAPDPAGLNVEDAAAAMDAPAAQGAAQGTAPRDPLGGGGRVVRGFRQAKGAMREGVVLQGKGGGAVRSMVAGEVLYSGPFRQYGGMVIVKAASGEDVVYGGLGALNVMPGARVLAGDVVGSLADDGRLYWEVRRRGRVVNPLRR